MSIFSSGFNLPPGVSTLPGEEPYFCDVCYSTEDECVCPECKVCGEVGNADCYTEFNNMKDESRHPLHFMELTEEQRATRERNEELMQEEAAADREYCNQQIQAMEEGCE
jgi:hypothetical protein